MLHEDQSGSELLLIEKAISGDKHAFGRLYEMYIAKIFNYLFYRIGEYSTATDMTEMVFLNAWENLPRFGRQGMNFRAWLYRIAHNLMVDYHRGKKEEIPLDDFADQFMVTPDLEEGSIDREKIEKIRTALYQLDEISRQVILLRFFAEINHKETAKILEISEGNVRVIQYRALKRLKGFLGVADE